MIRISQQYLDIVRLVSPRLIMIEPSAMALVWVKGQGAMPQGEDGTVLCHNGEV